MPDDKKAVSIMVPSKDPKKKDGDKDGGGGDKEVTTLDGVGGGGAADGDPKTKKSKGKDSILEPEELSDEDKALKEGLELAVTRVDDTEPGIGGSCLPACLAASGSYFVSCFGLRVSSTSETRSHPQTEPVSVPLSLSLSPETTLARPGQPCAADNAESPLFFVSSGSRSPALASPSSSSSTR